MKSFDAKPRTSTRKSSLGNAVLLLLSVLTGVLILEGGLRLASPPDIPSIYMADVYGNVLYKKNLDTYVFNAESNQKVHLKTNSEGFIGNDRSVTNETGGFRIAVLGDSFVAGRQVDVENSFLMLTEEKLNRISDRPVEVMNFGVGGQGTVEELLRYYHYVRKFRPDLVVVVFFMNDIENNSYYLPNCELFINDTEEWTKLTPAEGNFSIRTDWKYWLKKYSYMVRYADRIFRSNPSLKRLAQQLGIFDYNVLDEATKVDYPTIWSGGDVGSNFLVYLDPMPDIHEEALGATKDILTKFRDIVETDGSEFLLVYLPSAVEVDPIVQSGVAAPPNGAYDFKQLNERLKAFADASKIWYLDLAPPFAKYYQLQEDPPLYFSRTGHLTIEGHRVLAEVLAPYLARMSGETAISNSSATTNAASKPQTLPEPY